MQNQSFQSWGIIELLGHARIAGKISESQIGGCSFIRVDVPSLYDFLTLKKKGFTKYFSPAAIYSITPTDQDAAEISAKSIDADPFVQYELTQEHYRMKGRIAELEGIINQWDIKKNDELITDADVAHDSYPLHDALQNGWDPNFKADEEFEPAPDEHEFQGDIDPLTGLPPDIPEFDVQPDTNAFGITPEREEEIYKMADENPDECPVDYFLKEKETPQIKPGHPHENWDF